MTAFRRPLTGRFYRYPQRGWVAGVCAGVADWLDISVRWVRVGTLLGLLISGFFPLALIYAALWYAMDVAPEGHSTRDREPVDRPRVEPATRRTPSEPADIESAFTRLERRLRDLEAGVTEPDFKLRREFRDLERQSSHGA